jgi:outer membrane protein assembly factor BamA
MKVVILTGLFLCFLLPAIRSNPDTSAKVVIGQITLEGNRITRPRIILRELKFNTGDTVFIQDLPEILVKSRQNVFNTGLFNVVRIDTLRDDLSPGKLNISVSVIERWYLWPIPYLEFPNRNFNAWLEEPDLSHLTWGMNVKLFNVRGRNETLTAIVYMGFNPRYGFTYQTPYLNRKQSWGIGFGAGWGFNKSLISGTTGNKDVYLSVPGEILSTQVTAYAETFFRPGLYSYHTLSVSYRYSDFADTLLNTPGYLTYPTRYYSFFSLYYKFKLDHRDVRYYPLTGYYFDVELIKTGLSGHPVNLFSVQSSFRRYDLLLDRFYWATGITLKCSWPSEQPFAFQQNLGYGRDYIRGFEYYTINGNWFVIWKNNLKFALVRPRTGSISFIRNPKFGVVPYGIFLNLFADAGFVNEPAAGDPADNPLVNRFLGGYGISVDLVTYYDIVIDLGLAMNSLGIPGIYIHFTAPI